MDVYVSKCTKTPDGSENKPLKRPSTVWDLEYHRPCASYRETSKVRERYNTTVFRAKSTSQTPTSLSTIEHSKARTLPFNVAILFVFGFETRS